MNHCHRCGSEAAGGFSRFTASGLIESTCWSCVDVVSREETAQQLAEFKHWCYDADRLVLVHKRTHTYAYEVDVEGCNTATAALDWIAQVAGKTWAQDEPACIGELVIAMNILLGFQQRLCGFGMSGRDGQRINARKVLRARHGELSLRSEIA